MINEPLDEIDRVLKLQEYIKQRIKSERFFFRNETKARYFLCYS